MLPGHRYNLILSVERITHYQRQTWDREGEETVYRYALHDLTGDHYVFTGKWIFGFEVGKTFEIRATLKEYETRFRCWRLKRVALLREIKEGETLAFS